MGSELLVNIKSDSQLDKCDITAANCKYKKLPSRLIKFILAFTQSKLYADVLIRISLGMAVNGNREK